MGKRVVFTFGRFNPPTVGHGKLIGAVVALANMKRADHRIYASHSQDAKKNPLPYREKVHFMKALFPGANVIVNDRVRTVMDAIKDMTGAGYTDITMVIGEDRMGEFGPLIQKYQKDLGYEKFTTASAGKRTGGFVAGASATKMRAFVNANDFNSFLKYSPTKNRTLAKQVFDTTKRYLKEAAGDTEKAKYKKKLRRNSYGNKDSITYNVVPADSVNTTAGAGQMFSAFQRIGEEIIKRYLNRRK